MNKLLYFLFIITFVILLSACSFNNVAYEEAMEAGLEELNTRHYVQAEKSFRLALDEKPDDDKAEKLLQQTLLIKQAASDISAGQLDVATISLSRLVDTEDISESIAAHLDELQDQIKTLEATHKEYTILYQEAKDVFSDDKHDEALKVLETVLAQDLTHAYYASIKEAIDKLQKEVTTAKDAATAKADEKKKEAERMAAEKAAAELKAQKEKDEAASKGIGSLDGYWYNKAYDQACHITRSFIHCAVPKSDIITEADVTKIKRISDTELEISYVGEEFSEETEEYIIVRFTVNYKQIIPNQIIVNSEPGTPYIRVTKAEANAVFSGEYELR